METIFNNGITVKKFTGFVTPSIIMFLFMAMYFLIDTLFVANIVGQNALAAMNIAYPLSGFGWGISIMFASGSSAIVAIKMGEGKIREGNEKFSLICIVSLLLGILLTLVLLLLIEPLMGLLGATPLLWDYCVPYAFVMILGFPAVFLGVILEYYIRVDGKPGFTLFLYVLGGIVNIILDYLFIAVLGFGIVGAAWATIAGQYTVMVVGICYFITQKTRLKFLKPKWDGKYIIDSMVNGSSEMVSESSVAITIILFNLVVLRLAGEPGVAALAVVLDAQYLLISIHLGFITGVAPLISYYYGAKEYSKVNLFLKYSRNFMAVASVAVALIAFFCAPLISGFFVERHSEAYNLAIEGIKFLAIAFLFTGINVFASGFFTAYANGKISALISFSRGFIFIVIGSLTLPFVLGIEGVWLTITLAEVITFFLSLFMFRRYKNTYHYRFYEKGSQTAGK